MLRRICQRLDLPFTCLVCRHDLVFKNIVTSATANAGYKRYDRKDNAVRQGVTDTDTRSTSSDSQPLEYDKSLGTTSFPTIETHMQTFNNIKYTDLPIVHVKSTSNNTIITLTDGEGVVLSIQSGGSVGFRNAKKGTNVAAQATAIALAGDALQRELGTVRVCLKGIGPGRLPALKALALSGINIVSITDTTVLPHNGNRPKKARRL